VLVFRAGPYNALGTTGTVPRAYDIFRAYEGMGGKNEKQENVIQNKIQGFKDIFFKNQNSL
jgi:hypothetical protein